jgi:hypothetical protein
MNLAKSLRIALLLLLASCGNATTSSPSENVFRIDGEVTEEVLDALERRLEVPGEGPLTLAVTSEGGSARNFARLAILIQRHELELVIDEFCLSSCAEYLFPSTRNLVVADDAIIGFHGNPLLELYLLRSTGEEAPFCAEQAGRALEYVYRQSGANSDFCELQRDVLKPYDVSVIEGPGCKTVGYKRQVDTWLPGRQELEGLLGRALPNPVCADRAECVQRRALPLLGADRVIVAGGVRYSVN